MDIVETVLAEAEGYDLIIVGASEEPVFRNLLLGDISEQIAERASVTVIIVKRRRAGFTLSCARRCWVQRGGRGSKKEEAVISSV